MTRHLRAGLVIAASRIFAQLAQFVVFLLAAALMGPAEFGIFALVSAWAYILGALAGSGWAEYVMQWHEPEEAVPRRVLGLSVISGGAMALIAATLTLAVPLITRDPVVMPLMLLFAVTILLGAVANTLSGVLNWQGRLVPSALAMIAADLAGLVVSVAVLFAGYGVFALALGRIVFTGTWMGIGFATSRMSPDFRLRRAEIRPVLAYVSRIIVVRLLMNLRLYSATLVIGIFLGAAETGWFRAGQRLAGAVGEVLTEPGRVLAWSLFRDARTREPEGEGFQRTARRIFPLALSVALPLFAALVLLAEDIILTLLGPAWLPAVPVLQALAVAQAIFTTGFALEPVLSLAGAVKVLPGIMLVSSLIGLALTLVAAPFGMVWIALAQVMAAVLIFLYNARMLWRHAGVDWRLIARDCRSQCLAVVIAGGATRLMRDSGIAGAGWIAVLVLGATLVLIHLAVLCILDPLILGRAVSMLRRSESTRY